MPRTQHYSPAIQRFLVSALYHEAKARRQKMTTLVNNLLTEALANGEGWREALKQQEQKRAA